MTMSERTVSRAERHKCTNIFISGNEVHKLDKNKQLKQTNIYKERKKENHRNAY